MSTPLFKNRKLLIATKHEKEKVIAPLLEKTLGVTCVTTKNFDTDVLGTFSGEIERELDPIATVRKKCLMAMNASNCDLGVASEGSFGQHPYLFFAKADEEFLIFIDLKNNLEIIARELSTDTNFEGKTIKTKKELISFAEAIKFPTHGLILRKSEKNKTDIITVIKDEVVLLQAYEKLSEESDSVYVETDMRAMHNPTRMTVIEHATKKLIAKIISCCPQCETPGFEIATALKGLKCSLCGLPTKSTLSFIYKCKQCEYCKEEKYPNKKTTEDPMYCNYCNP
ncbi:MAG: DUF6671 family protein [Flavobacteriales bacterium]